MMKTKKNKPELSIIIITKYEEEGIEQCIKSVLAGVRNIKSFEIILVDSGSIDKTRSIIGKFYSKLKIIKLPEEFPKNASSARNFGFKNSSGRYIQFLDGDTVISGTWLKKSLDFLKNSRSDIASVTGEISQSKSGNPYYEKFRKFLEIETRTKEVRELKSIINSFMIKREVFESVGGFDSNLFACEEGELSDRIRSIGKKTILMPYKMCHHKPKLEAGFGFLDLVKKRLYFSISEGKVLRKAIDSRRKEAFRYRLFMYKFHFLFAFYVVFGLVSFFTFFIFNIFQNHAFLWILSLILFLGLIKTIERDSFRNTFYYFTCHIFSWLFFFWGIIRGVRK